MNESALIITDFHQISFPLSKLAFPLIEIVDAQEFDINSLFQHVIENNLANTYILSISKPKSYFKKLKSTVKFIKAAGGLVKNSNSEYLFIKRLGKWDLPKGKAEANEKMRNAALREVEEECGIKVDCLGDKLNSTFHIYSLKNELILKKTNWYKMEVNSVPDLTPQYEEDITEAKWISIKSLNKVRDNTYPLIKGLISNIK